MRKLPEVLSEEEIGRLLSVPNKRYRTGMTQYLMIRVALETGLRISSLINLRRENLNLLSGRVNIQNAKGGKDYRVFFNRETRDLLADYWEMMGESDYCFSNLSGGKLIDANLRRSIKKLGSKCGIDRVHWHLLRHTALTRLYEQTRDIRLVQEIANHADISTTMIYTHISGENVREVLLANCVG